MAAARSLAIEDLRVVAQSLNTIGKLIIIALMYSGRLGPITFGIALVQQRPPEPPGPPPEELVV